MLPGKDTSLPLDKVFIKSRLDLLTARAWLAEDPQVTSVGWSVGCLTGWLAGWAVGREGGRSPAQRAPRGSRQMLAGVVVGGPRGDAENVCNSDGTVPCMRHGALLMRS